jgi:hypothetical protein
MKDYAHDNAELGAVLNGFSLSETGHLASALEKTGQAIDTTYISTARLVRHYFTFLSDCRVEVRLVGRLRTNMDRTAA